MLLVLRLDACAMCNAKNPAAHIEVFGSSTMLGECGSHVNDKLPEYEIAELTELEEHT